MDFKSEVRDVLEDVKNGLNKADMIASESAEEADQYQQKVIDSFFSSLLALIEKRMPKEKYVNREENPLKDYGEQIGFNQCLSEIKKGMGIK